MAALTRNTLTLSGFIGALGATAAGGDDFALAEGETLVFFNAHTSSITINLVAVAATVQAVGAFPVPLANRAIVLPAGQALFLPISSQNLAGFMNTSTGRVSVTYTGHNALLQGGVLTRL